MSLMTLPQWAEEDSEVRRLLEDRDLNHHEVVRLINAIGNDGLVTSDTSVRRYRKRLPLHTEPDKGDAGVIKGSADVTSEGVTFNGVLLEGINCQIAKDWTPIFAIFQLDPDDFDIVDDTVKISTWQQSKRLENGDRDTVQLFSHSARFKRKSTIAITEEQRAVWRTSLVANPMLYVDMYGAADDGGSYLTLLADPQLGKKGTDEAVENWKRGVLGHIAAISSLQEMDRGPNSVHVAWQGDESEGYANNYTNQSATIELNLSAQLELDFDMRMWTLREFAKLGLPISASSVISNHGEWTRNGGKDPVTTRGDNSSTHIARQVAKAFKEIEPFGGPKIDWTIGGGEPGVVVNLSGHDCYFSHGYIEKGKGGSTEIRTKVAIERQILAKPETLGSLKLWFMAHYHHFYMQEFEGRTLFGCPALEADRSSEYMLDQYGVWSPNGTLGMVVGRDQKRGWSDLSVF